MLTIYALTDYKNRFGSKWKSKPYRSGYDKNKLEKYFNKYGYNIKFVPMKDVRFNTNFWKGKLVIYTSSEEIDLNYKNFIEDIILGLENIGAEVIPGYDFLRANNNKVYMEILRESLLGKELSGNKSRYYGTLDELKQDLEQDKINFPCVIKSAAGAMSRGVYLAKNKKQLIKYSKKISRTPHYFAEIKEYIRKLKYKGYKIESKFQNKFIIQNYIADLENDWKILVYGDHYFIFERPVRKNDFRASGSGADNYIYGSRVNFPSGIFDFASNIYNSVNLPVLSLDIAYDERFYLLEFQAVYFGTVGQYKSDVYYQYKNGKWNAEENKFDQEEEYVWGLVKYLQDKGFNNQ